MKTTKIKKLMVELKSKAKREIKDLQLEKII